VATAARATAPTFQRSRSWKDGLPDPSLATPLAGVTSTMRSTPCYARHLIGILGPSSIAVLSSSTVAGFTQTVGRRPAWCAVRRTVSGVRRSAQSTILSLSGTQLRWPCKMSHGVRFHTTCRRFDPGGSLDRRVNCRCVSQPRWVGARWNTRGKKGNRGSCYPAPRADALAVGGYKCS
jgi:hypothetical protein